MPTPRMLWKVFVPTEFGDTRKIIRKRHHKQWDQYVRKMAGGSTREPVANGEWIEPHTQKLYAERIIPVYIYCTRNQIDRIIDFTLKHYRQKAVMAYKVSDDVILRFAEKTPSSLPLSA